MARISRVFTYTEIDYLESRLYAIDSKFFLLRNRAGQFLFSIYAMDGTPTVTDIMYVFRKGDGLCKMLDGDPLPKAGLHVLENGWGVVATPMFWQGSPSSQLAVVVSNAFALRWEFMHENPKGLREAITFKARSIVRRVRSKIAAFRAA